MRGVVLALLLSLVGSQQSSLQKPSFARGKVHKYEYNGTIYNTVRGNGLAVSALQLIATLEIYGQADGNKNTLKILNPRLAEYVGFPQRVNFVDSAKKTAVIETCANSKYKFEYLEGLVREIYAQQGASVFCVNLVRGMLNMMHMTLGNREEDAYELSEQGLEGDCNTRYVVQRDREDNVATITRSKDLNNCQNKVAQNIGLSYVRPLPASPLKEKMVKGTAAFIIKLKRGHEGSQIAHVESEQVYEFSPFSESDGAAVMTAKQHLKLTEIKTSAKEPEVQWGNRRSIRYEFPKETPPQMLIKTTNPEQEVKEILEELGRGNIQDIRADAVAEKYLQLSQLCRRLNAVTLTKLFKEFNNRPCARRALLIGSAYAGTADSMTFIKNKLREFSLYEQVWVIPITFHFASPNDQTVAVAKDILSILIEQQLFVVKMLGILGYGSLVNRHCTQSRSCTNQILQPLHELLKNGAQEGDMLLALNAVGNAGQSASLKLVMRYTNTDYPDHIQAEAVRTMMQIAQQDPTKVRENLILILLDPTRCLTARMMAWIAIWETKPTLPVITAIADMLLRDNSLQLGSFVYSYMKNLANVGLPHLFNVSSACNIAIKLLNTKYDQLSYRYSKAVLYSLYSNQYKFGVFGKFFWMNTPKSVVPTDIILSPEIIFAGASIQPIEVALHAQGLMELLRNQNLDHYSTHQKTEREGGKWSSPEDPLVFGSLKMLGQNLGVFKADLKDMQEAWKHIVNMGIGLGKPSMEKPYHKHGNTSQYRYDSDALDTQQTSSGREDTERALKIQQEMSHALIVETQYRVPTLLGLPCEASGSGVVVAHGSMKANAKTSPSQDSSRLPGLGSVQVNVDSNIALYGQGVLIWGINTNEMQHIVEIKGKFQAQASPKFTATLDLKKKNVKIETTPLQKQVEVLMISHEAHVVSRDSSSQEAKKPVLPRIRQTCIEEQVFNPGESILSGRDITDRNSAQEQNDEVERGYSKGKSDCDFPAVQIPVFQAEVCKQTLKKTRDIVPIQKTWLHFLCEEHAVKILLRKAQRDNEPIDAIKGELQLESGWFFDTGRTRRSAGYDDDDDYDDSLGKAIAEDKKGHKDAHEAQKKQSVKKSKCRDDAAPSKSDRSSSSSSSASKSSSSSSASSSSSSSPKWFSWIYKKKQRESGSSDSSDGSSSSDSSGSSDSSSSDSSSRSSDDSSSSSSESKGRRQHGGRRSSRRRSRDKSSSSSSDSSSSSSSSDSSGSSSSSESKGRNYHRDRRASHRRSGDKSSSSSSSSSDRSSSSSGHSRNTSGSSRSSSRRSSGSSHHSSSGSSSSSSSGSRRHSSSGSRSSSSSSSSKESVENKNMLKVLAFSLHGFKNYKSVEGYDTVVYAASSKLYVRMNDVKIPSTPEVCFTAAVSKHKMQTSLNGGRNCQEYKVEAVLQTGMYADHPAIQLKAVFSKVPLYMKNIAKNLYTLIPGIAFMMGLSQKEKNNPSKQFEVVVSLKDSRAYNLVIKTPTDVFYASDSVLPLPFPMNPPIYMPQIWNAPSLLINSAKGVCSVNDKSVTTFNGVEVRNALPPNCFQILMKDCKKGNSPLVMMKHQTEKPNYKELSFSLGPLMINFKKNLAAEDGDIKTNKSKSRKNLIVEVNDMRIDKFPYTVDSKSFITIESRDGKLLLIAPKLGIEQIAYDGIKIKIEASALLAGQLCGLCGQFDAEKEKEFTIPTGYLAKDSLSFAQSWLSLNNKSEACEVEYERINLEKQFQGIKSNCSSNMPVLRCRNSCTPTKTIKVSVGLHCVPSESTVNKDTREKSEKSEDLVEEVDSHMLCSC